MIPSRSATSRRAADDAPLLDELSRRLAAVQPNGCVVLACDNGRGTARAAVVAQKYTDKAVAFVSEGERKLLLDDLGAYF